MKLPGEDEQRPMGFSVIYTVIGISAFVLIMLFVVMKSNDKDGGSSEYVKQSLQQQQEQAAAQQALEEDAVDEETEAGTEKKLRAEDLDFWDMYPVEGEEVEESNSNSGTKANSSSEKSEEDEEDEEDNKSNNKKEDSDKGKEENVQNDPSRDGKHTLVKSADGTEEWVLINPYLPKNTYDFTNLSESANIRKYTENGKKISYIGADISKHDGNVNFNSLKATGVDFVIIRLGARGYATGQLTLDEYFVENMEAAIEAELDIGVYFYSQAISQEEANQEANFVVQNLEPYRAHIKYPVAFAMEKISNDQARTDTLTRENKTTIANTFLGGIQAAGYVPMLYGNKEYLIKSVDLTQLQNYDVWLSQEEEIPDYPYQYTMWQYTTTGVLNGIKGDANLNICFVSYSDR
ncbi:MAG: glycoside hydrolase family 25 protein [Lachnospiraceae bacterium]|nr:glycoside hydrolase family 25 protein [Lachnospiraceae bacterium]